MNFNDLSPADLVQWVRAQQGQKLTWLDTFTSGHRKRGDLEINQKRRDLFMLRALERYLKTGRIGDDDKGTDEGGMPGGTAAGNLDAGTGLSEMDRGRSDDGGASGSSDRLPEGRLL